ncbi:MotA/TolQ/ExbB proton channel family protein [Pseudoalteromonas sp. SWXJZ94C]|uniref:MotA/TolQ/ExbB proton channel family protein n=2 Tax=Pseudoalteromonas TaxID=53246 RepID=UPI00140856C2|nr:MULTISPECIES: MotA/TolQ/ExbB proton channel family protein [unclassified Pseudoalteromonas]MBH0058820.1 MotA/TolQ/ExbB proton channel family protein [Pseudoalteromonas sp. SWXJZ94C]
MESVFNAIGVMAWPLLCLSIIALAIVLERSYVLVFAKWQLQQHKAGSSQFASALKSRQQQPSEQRLQWCQLYLQDCVVNWRKRLNMLSLLASLSPLMGLLGTVWGLVVMFKNIAQTNQAVTPALLADGLWEAMYSTMAGLVIAIPCLLASGLLNGLLDGLQNEFTRIINHLNYKFTFNELPHA